MNHQRLIALITLFLLAFGHVHAQDHPTLTLEAATYAENAASEADDMFLAASGVRFSFPMVVGDTGLRLVHEGIWRHVDQNVGNEYAGDHGDAVLHSNVYIYRLMAEYQVSSAWFVTGSVAPTLQSEMKHSPGDFRWLVNGSGYVTRQLNERAYIGAGLGYSRLYGASGVYPVIAVRWQNGGSLEVDALLPERAEAWWMPHPRIGIGMTSHVYGDEYRTGHLAALDMEEGQIGFTNAAVGPAVRFRFGQTLTIAAEAGTIAYRSLSVKDVSQEVSLDPGDSYYFRMNITLGIR